MQAILKISKKAPESNAKDFAFLKEQGIKYIQRVAGNNWTDYNAHDPGITILESLAYAINDLANRTSFDIKDLLAENNGQQGKQAHFFEPEEILSSNPVTINDLRKVVIDVPGIKNAWLEPKVGNSFYSDGPTVYHDTDKDLLTYLSDDEQTPISFIGLYDVLLEFEYHPEFGDLNSNTVSLPLEITDPDSKLYGFKANLAAQFPYWDDKIFPDSDLSQLSEAQLNEFKRETLLSRIDDVDVTLYRGHDKIRLLLDDVQEFPQDRGTLQITDRISGQRMTEEEEELKAAILTVLGQLAEKYYNKVLLVRKLVGNVNKRLQRHRNLCEDFTNFKSLQVKELALCIKVELKYNAIPNKVLSRIYHALELFLAPSLQWASLKELIDRKVPMDEIFEGPTLDHGFLSDSQMKVTDRRKSIYVSDLINVISDIAGVEFLGEIEIGLKDGREFKIQESQDHWHVPLDHGNAEETYFIPRLNIDHSNIRFYKSGIPLSTNRDEVNNLLNGLRSGDSSQTLATDDSEKSTIRGKSREVGEYASIQSDLPMTYGIGDFGLSTSETPQRKAQAHQLKGYLVIFEQLLSNYLAQLQNINRLFSLDASIDRTYFVQDLYDVPNLAPLLTDFLSESGFSNDPTKDDRQDLKAKWASFIDPLQNTENAYLKHVQEIAEGKKTNKYGETESIFLDRRNRFLDHLLARFGEQIEDYANVMHSIDSDVSDHQLIEDKSLLLKDYPTISANRGKGFDYTSESEQLSGLEMRITRLLGIALSGETTNRVTFGSRKNNKGQFGFTLKNQANQVVLRGVEFYDTSQSIDEIKQQLIEHGLEYDNYFKQVSNDNTFYFEFRVDGKTIGRSISHKDDADKALEQIMLCVDQLRVDDEQVLVIEHLLLRPKLSQRDKLLPAHEVTNYHDEPICCPGNTDPYSFIISVVLPSWPARFRNLDFRRYVEDKIRLETPAHIFPKICWVTRETMNALDQSLRDWKSAMAAVDFNDELFISGFGRDSLDTLINNVLESLPEIDGGLRAQIQGAIALLKTQSQSEELTKEERESILLKTDSLEKMSKVLERSDRHNMLIETMQSMRNVYPIATLYDCRDSSANNPIALNQTKLGTFKPLEDE